jgi:RHS repeat-associated protein
MSKLVVALQRTSLHHDDGARGALALLAALVALLAGPAGLVSSAAADTHLGTTVYYGSATWTAAASPYVLDGNVTVAPGGTLTIEPGTVVKVNGQYGQLAVGGTLNAVGTSSARIVFTSYQDDSAGGDSNGDGSATSPSPGQWYDISVSAGASANFSYADVRYGGYGSATWAYGAIVADPAATLKLDRSSISYNMESGILVPTGSGTGVSVTNSSLSHNGDGISSNGGYFYVASSSIVDNRQYGAFVNMASSSGPGPEFRANTITRNASNGIYLQVSCSVPAASFPHGNYNNLYGNGSSSPPADGSELYAECRETAVDWRWNYWGPNVAYGPSSYCDNSSYLYYLDDRRPPFAGTSIPIPSYGPVSTNYNADSGPCGLYFYPYNLIQVGPREDIQWSPIQNDVPAPEPANFNGGASPSSMYCVKCVAGDPVNAATGNFFESYRDFAIAGLGLGLGLERTYNTLAATAAPAPGPFGYGWSASYYESLQVAQGSQNVIVTQADGSTVPFLHNPDGSYSPPAWVQATLRKNGDGSYTYTLPDQHTLSFNGSGKLQSEADRNANKTTLSYDGSGNLATVTDPAGRSLRFTYNADGTVATATDPAGHAVTYTYLGGQLSSVTDVNGGITRFGYDGGRRLQTITDPRNHTVVTNTYDSASRVTSQATPRGTTTFDYSTPNDTKITDPDHHVTDEQFQNYLPTSITKGYGTSAAATTAIAYNGNLLPNKVTDPNGHDWTYGYDASGNRTSVTDPLSHTVSSTYDAKRDLTSLTTPLGHETDYTYDANGNVITVKRKLTETGDTATTTLAYDPSGNGELKTATDPLGRAWTFGYDANGDRISVTSPLNHTSTATFDIDSFLHSSTSARGNEARQKPAAYTTTYTNDKFGNPTDILDPNGSHTLLTYDANENLTDVTDRDGRHTQSSYDNADQLTQVTRGDGSILKTGYDGEGNITSQTDGLNHVTTYAHDPLERVSSIQDPLGRTVSYGYDANGNVSSLTDQRQQTTNYTYDQANRVTTISYASGNPTDQTFHYTADGQRSSMTDQSGTSGYSYDSLGRLTAQTNAAGQTTSYAYDLADQLRSIGYPAALTALDLTNPQSQQSHISEGAVTRSYDADGNLKTVGDWLGKTTSFGYDADEQLSTVTRPNGTSASYVYDHNDELTSLADATGTEAVGRSAAGLINSLTPPVKQARAQAYGYDGATHLTTAGPGAYHTDAADNLNQTLSPSGQAVTQNFDIANELASTSIASQTTNTLGYDQDGNRTSAVDQSGVRTTYTWDQANELTGYQGPDHTNPGQTVSDTFVYDASGLRQTKTRNNQLTNQAYDLADGLALMIEDGPTAYISGPGGLPIEQIDQSGNARYYSQDHAGSTSALTDPAGKTLASYSYDAYGNPTNAAQPVTTPFGYTGQYTDAETGLQYLRARYYDPATGQLLGRDPLAPATRQPYTYSADNPLNLADPSGLNIFDKVLAGASAAWNFGNGAADTLTSPLGLVGLPTTASIRDSLGGLGVSVCSTSYGIGQVGGLAVGVLIPGEGEGELAAEAETRIAGDAEGFIGPGGHSNVPSDWVTRPNSRGNGQRYSDPNNPRGNYVRIEEDAVHGHHVHVTSGGRPVLYDDDRHIPFEVWDNWSTFGGP